MSVVCCVPFLRSVASAHVHMTVSNLDLLAGVLIIIALNLTSNGCII